MIKVQALGSLSTLMIGHGMLQLPISPTPIYALKLPGKFQWCSTKHTHTPKGWTPRKLSLWDAKQLSLKVANTQETVRVWSTYPFTKPPSSTVEAYWVFGLERGVAALWPSVEVSQVFGIAWVWHLFTVLPDKAGAVMATLHLLHAAAPHNLCMAYARTPPPEAPLAPLKNLHSCLMTMPGKVKRVVKLSQVIWWQPQ